MVRASVTTSGDKSIPVAFARDEEAAPARVREVPLHSQSHPRSSPAAHIAIAAIIPLYNGAPFIREALESVLAQTEPADEIIVVDDGSTDNGPEIVKEMAKSHPIRLISKTNGGQSSARNLGVAQCCSSHIALLDQDDVWYENHLAALKRPFLKGDISNLALVYGNLDRIDRGGRLIYRQFLDNLPIPHPKLSLFDCLAYDMFILPGASLFTKKAFEQVGGFDERLSGYEDDDLFIRMFTGGFQSVYLREIAVTRWRIYTSSTSYSPRMAKSRMIYFRKLVETFPNEPRLNLYWVRDAIGPRFFDHACSEFIDGSRSRDRTRMAQAWCDLKGILPVMRRRVRWRVALVAPLIEVLHRGPLGSFARRLLRLAVRSRK